MQLLKLDLEPWIHYLQIELPPGQVQVPRCVVPSGYVKIAIENGPVEIVDLPIENGDFP